MQDIEKKVIEFKEILESEDPIILAKLQIEVQLETMRMLAYALQDANDKLGAMEKRIDSVDWKLWEIAKVIVPSINQEPDDIEK